MAGMAVGSAVGQNIAGTISGTMPAANMQVSSNGTVPPPVPETMYYVAVNGQPTGPYSMAVLTSMIVNHQVTSSSLVWKNGMSEWFKADLVDELKNLFNTNIPPIPETKE